MRIRCGLLLLLSSPWLARAGEATPSGVSASSFVQAMIALLLIIGLLLALAWMARKVSGGKGFGQGGMTLIGGVALGPRERIVLLEVGDTWLVVGIVPGQIRTLHRLPKGSTPPLATGRGEASFSQWLHSIAERGKKNG